MLQFLICITEINNTEVENAEHVDLFNLIEYSDAYSKTSGRLWQYYGDKPALEDNGNIIDFPANNKNRASFKCNQQMTWKTVNGETQNVEIIAPLNCLSNFC